MIHQYKAQRFTRHNGRNVGTIPIGTIIYIQDIRPMGVDRFWSPVFRNPWIVESWQNRDTNQIGASEPVYMAGGHLATVRSLRTGRRAQVADWLLLASLDAA